MMSLIVKQDRGGLTILTFAVFLLVWETISKSGIFNVNLFPPPSTVAQALFSMLLSGELITDVLVSLQRVVIGFFIGSLLGIVLGVLTGRIEFFEKTVGQLIQLFRSIPAIAFVPFAIIWFGLGEYSKYFLIMWGVFFPAWISTHIGVSNVDTKLIWAAKSLGATDRKVLYEVVIPHAIPFIIAGARTGIAIAFICLFAAEMAGAFGGIGYRISVSYLTFRVDEMMAALAVLGMLGACADAMFSKVMARTFPWQMGVKI